MAAALFVGVDRYIILDHAVRLQSALNLWLNWEVTERAGFETAVVFGGVVNIL